MAYFDPFPIHYRLQGALDALRDAGISQQPEYLKSVISTEPRFEVGYRQMLELLQQPALPTAIFAMTDELAIGALHALSGHRVRVPEDISIIGFDNIPMASFILPALTTIEQPAMQIGETAGRILLKALEDDSSGVQRVALPTRLIVRDSTAPPRR
jgi:LacI family transcriptional regulator